MLFMGFETRVMPESRYPAIPAVPGVTIGRYLGIGGVQQLEAAVAAEAVHDVRPHASSGCLGPLEDEMLDAGRLQAPGAGEAGQPGPHDHHVRPHLPDGTRRYQAGRGSDG